MGKAKSTRPEPRLWLLLLPIPGAGHYTLTTQMAAFSPASRNVDVENVYTLVDFNVVLLSRSEQPKTEEHAQTPTSVGGNRGFRTLGVVQGENAQDSSSNEQVVPSGMPIPGIAADSASESIAVSGNSSGVSMMSTDEMEQRMREGRGSRPVWRANGAASRRWTVWWRRPRPFGGAGRGRFNLNKPHGTLYYSVGDSALDASPYSLTGQPLRNPTTFSSGSEAHWVVRSIFRSHIKAAARPSFL